VRLGRISMMRVDPRWLGARDRRDKPGDHSLRVS
jgi:hypothetical protein